MKNKNNICRTRKSHNLLARKIYITTISFSYFYNAIAETTSGIQNCSVVGGTAVLGIL
jgi:hypothetical protein